MIHHQVTLNPKERRHYLAGHPGLWEMKRAFQINFLTQQGLKPDHHFLDIGCGTLRGGIPIIAFLNEGRYIGIDVRSNVIKQAKKELTASGLEHKQPELIKFDDFNALELNVEFDIVFAFSVLIHLEDSIAEKCFQFVHKRLSASGTFWANANVIDHVDGRWQGFPVVFRSLEFYKNLAQKAGLNMKVVGSLKDLGHISNRELSDKQVMLEFKKWSNSP